MGRQFQFDLKRLLLVVTIAALIAGLFACVHLQIALLTLAVTDLIASIGFEAKTKSRLASLLLVSAILILATFHFTHFTDWRVWAFAIAACVVHVVTAFVWLIDEA